MESIEKQINTDTENNSKEITGECEEDLQKTDYEIASDPHKYSNYQIAENQLNDNISIYMIFVDILAQTKKQNGTINAPQDCFQNTISNVQNFQFENNFTVNNVFDGYKQPE